MYYCIMLRHINVQLKRLIYQPSCRRMTLCCIFRKKRKVMSQIQSLFLKSNPRYQSMYYHFQSSYLDALYVSLHTPCMMT